MNNSSISVFKSFFIHKTLTHPQKSEKIRKKNPEKSNKFKDFFEDFKNRIPNLGLNNPSLELIN